jgi:hypothetical protein
MDQVVYMRRRDSAALDPAKGASSKIPRKVVQAGPEEQKKLAGLKSLFGEIPSLTASEPELCFSAGIMNGSLRGPGVESALVDTHYAGYFKDGPEAGTVRFSFLTRSGFGGEDPEKLYVMSHGQGMGFLHSEFAMNVDISTASAQVIIKNPGFVMVDQALRIGFHVLSRLYKCFFVHACGVNYEGKGILFPAASGTGKTTIANASQRYQVLNDDTMMVDCNPEQPVIWGPPFAGRGGRSLLSNTKQELKALIFPVQSPNDRLTELMPGQAMAKLGRNVLMQGLNYQMAPAFLGMLESVVKSTRAFEMEFTKSSGFVDLLEQID